MAADATGEHGTAPHNETWEEWLQTHRVELNAMTTPQFIEWLDGKMAEHVRKTKLPDKLIPPGEVLETELATRIEQKTRAAITERILREAALDDQVAAAVKATKTPRAATLVKGIRTKSERAWHDHIEAVAAKVTKREE
jgi:hypothetical protein